MKKPNKKIRKKVITLLETLRYTFGFQNYEWCVQWMKEDNENDTADIQIEEDYQRITIRIYPCFMDLPVNDQRKAIVHECSHFLVFPLHDLSHRLIHGQLQTKEHLRIAVERSTSQVENLVHDFLQESFSDSKKAYKEFLGCPKKKTKKAR